MIVLNFARRVLLANRNCVSFLSTAKHSVDGVSPPQNDNNNRSSDGGAARSDGAQQRVRTSLNIVVESASSETTTTTTTKINVPEDEIATASTAAILGSKKTVSVPTNVAPTTLVADFDVARLRTSAATVNSGRSQTFLTGVNNQGFQINAVGCYGGVMLFPRFFTLWDQVTLDTLTIDAFKLVLLHNPRPTLLLVSKTYRSLSAAV
jgi:hypothetical protein